VGTDIVVTSPGWRPDHPLLAQALAAGLPVHGEAELAWRLRGADGSAPAPWLVITGTNGKTTTVHMLEAMLLAAGRRAIAVGNVGVSLIEAVMAGSGPSGYDVLAVELSSFQLHWSTTIVPAAGALLNLAPDHLDWHGTMAEYGAAKAKALIGPVAVGWLGDSVVADLLAAAPGRQIGVTLDAPAIGQLGVADGQLVDRAFGGLDGASGGGSSGAHAAGIELAAQADVRPAGRHNVVNALVAAALARSAGSPPAAIADGLARFVPDHHRNEHVLDVAVPGGAVAVVDDSKATNPHAAIASLMAYDRIVWVAGGQLKGAPIDELVAQVADRLVGVVLLGADRAQIAAALARHAPQVPVIDVAGGDDGVMTEVARAALRLAGAGDTVLLAPAAASLDMFASYGARGEAFVAAIRAAAGAS
ncbi:MAG: UDP-N-acetylmuramoylalanine/D-glutamate ligase, partial [Pseudonocardiales bacterium]|nr:UDP-N-acetylmuramoylalanine/D-glutamate ligase [Pseudonocardiales bacterium]